ncbi:efflux RND transporter periplasmic adaptor subunit [Derxia lacustris]|uniref:efflux RND transporter periplasmic adaptor subunit n=1 Tax=Derxia lacustris TaxID=764842 RepID=UPI000A16F127|nr:efflux RND transporter periplasmic adaptor subunit [Derxia lacustris]
MTQEQHGSAEPRALRHAGWIAGAVLLTLAAGAAVRVAASARHDQTLADSTAASAARSVLVAHARPAEGKRTLALPGSLRGQVEAQLYARTNGYLKRWNKDLGDRVRKGEVLAVIDAPETEQELAQARAAREQVQARLGLAETTLVRWRDLRTRDAVSQQEVDERAAALRSAQADLAAADANLRRLEQLLSFRQIVAPFDGVVTRRNVEIGALVSAGNTGSARELFRLVQTDPLRVGVAVPQVNAGDVRVGQEVTLRLLERPGQPIKGRIARTAGVVDADSRAMTVEVDVPNPDGKLLPGAYVEVALGLAGGARNLVVPAAALQYRQDGPRLALVDADGRVELRGVKLGRDLGKAVEVVGGLKAEDRFVLNPHDSIEAGETVLATDAPLPEPAGKDGKDAGPKDGKPDAGKADGKPEAANGGGKPDAAGAARPGARS